MKYIDLRNAIEGTEDNFTTQLFRLILKADNTNIMRLGQVFPIEVAMVKIFRSNCPYIDEEMTQVDYEKIEERANQSFQITEG
jgi:hypothetical protein